MNALNGVYSDIYTLKTKIQQGFIRIKKKSGRKLDFEDFSKSRKKCEYDLCCFGIIIE